MSQRPLQGVRILDLTHVWAGPLGIRLLADLGADVVKVEAPLARGAAESPATGAGLFVGGEPAADPWNRQALFIKLNRGRRGMCIDLKSHEGKSLLLALVREADVITENFSAHAMSNLGLGYDVLSDTNPQIIYVTMPGYGSDGPYSGLTAFGPSVEPMTGLGAMLGYSKAEPRNSAMALIDAVAGVSAASAMVTALNRRLTTGKGSRVELSLHEAGVSLFGDFLVAEQLGSQPQPTGNAHPHYAPHGIYPAQGDDNWLAIACPDAAAWSALRREIGESWLSDGRFDLAEQRLAQRAQLDELLGSWTRDQSKHDLAARLQQAGVPAGAVNTAPDVLQDEHLLQRGYWVDQALVDQPAVRYPGIAIRLNQQEAVYGRPAPKFGEHNREVLQDWLDASDARVDELIAGGVLLDRPPG